MNFNKLTIVQGLVVLVAVILSVWTLDALGSLVTSVDRNTQAINDLHTSITEFPAPVDHSLDIDTGDAGVVDSSVTQRPGGALDVSVTVIVAKEE